MDALLESRLTADAPALELGGNEPFRLDASETAWFIRQGKVEIFAVPPEDPELGARRTHLATLEAGQMMFSLETSRKRLPLGLTSKSEASTALLAMALPDTQLVQLPLSRLKEIARETECVPGLARLIETWLGQLFSRIDRAQPPKIFTPLEAGAEVVLPNAETVARTRSGVVWIRHVAGRSHFLGRAELPMQPEGFLLPISDETWLVATEETRLSCVDSGVLLRGGGLWEGLQRFHRLFLTYVDAILREAERAERERLRRKAELDARTMEGAYLRLASILEEQIVVTSRSMPAGDALVRACRLVANAQNLEIRTPPQAEKEAKTPFQLSRICAASRLRHRRVILRDDWFQTDNGPLLGFLAPAAEGESARPIALLPTSAQAYELVDPEDQSRIPVDSSVAARLEGAAFMFYPPLPERPLVFKDLLHAALSRRREDLVMVILTGAFGGLLGVLTPVLTGHIFGNIIPSADRSRLLQMTLALVVSALGAAAFQITRSIAILRLGGKVDGTLQAAVWDRLLSLPARFFRNYTTGDLADRAMGIDAIRELLTGQITTTLLAAVFSVFSFGLLFYYSWRLALLAVGLVLALVLVTSVLAMLQLRRQRQLQTLRGKLASLLFGLINGLSKLRVGGAEHRAFALWAERFTAQRQETIAAQKLAHFQASFNAAYGVLTTLALFAMVSTLLKDQETVLTVSQFLAFNAAFGQFQAAVLSILGLLPTILGAIPTYERLKPILETSPEVDPTKIPVGELAGDIEFSHISFRYQADGPLILDDVSFRARPGEFIALVGPSGSGKSTTLRLLLGFEQPAAGSIYFDGQDLPSLDLQSVRQQIGVVLQNGRPMVGDIFHNIVGNRNLTLDDAWEAARMAGLEEDIKSMPMGMHTIISEGAGTFSGGQQQRLMIARAIVHRPRIVLFDEATSALDNRTQEIVSRSLEQLKATRIVVAHRLSTIENADRIYVIEKGRVIESGNYQELIARGGLFSRLASRQIA